MADENPIDIPDYRDTIDIHRLNTKDDTIVATHNQLDGGEALLRKVDLFRLNATRRLDENRRGEMGQFLTPAPVARFMASMFRIQAQSVQLLDAGAGVGSLSAAFVTEMCRLKKRPRELKITAYEINPVLSEYLRETFEVCRAECERTGIVFTGEVRQENFIEAGASMLREDLFSPPKRTRANYAILNPPYRKINSKSRERRLLRSIGVETSNLYTGFLAIVVKLLDQGGQLVAITPRSFCNGPYFKPFRRLFLEIMTLRRVHVFNSRSLAFQDDKVLQENIIFHAVKRAKVREEVAISSNDGPEDKCITVRKMAYDELIRPGDHNFFIRLLTDDLDHHIARRIEDLKHTLKDIGISVSTGRVVDFRAREFLHDRPSKNTAPLIYPGHIERGFVKWPKNVNKKPNAILITPMTEDLLVQGETYVLVKRFTAKEERRRVVAGIYDPGRIQASRVGFENHLNYYHCNRRGLPPNLAKGLAVFLNSTLVDTYFRQFSGHTQVNAADLRSLKYPSREQLEELGSRIGETFPEQAEVDHLIEDY